MSLVERSYFTDELLIANSQDLAPNSNLLGNKKVLDSLIAKYERLALIKTLGYDLYSELQTKLENLNDAEYQTVKASADQKWKDLVNGCDVTIDGIKYRFEGLKPIGTFIADYIFYKYMENDAKNHTGVGMVSSESNNTTRVNSYQKMVNVWNDMVSKIIDSEETYILSLYFYLDYNTADFPNWKPLGFDFKNQMGL
jgi:uncharacterized protein YfbU (UPF0304 family)